MIPIAFSWQQPKNREARERLRVLEDTADGFRIAEADLKLRAGRNCSRQRQSGLPRFRLGTWRKKSGIDKKPRANWRPNIFKNEIFKNDCHFLSRV